MTVTKVLAGSAEPHKEESAVDGALMGHRVTEDIKGLILSGDLPPGSRIRQEELALRFGTSRIPVREALRQLQSEGLVTLKANSGAWVSRLDLNECLEVYKIRERIEPLAIAESVPNLDAGQIAQLEALFERMETAPNSDEFLRLDGEFHAISCSAAGMSELAALIERYWNRTQQYRRAWLRLVGSEGRWLTQCEHRLLLEGIKRRDGEEAANVLHGHIRRTRLALARRPELFS